jgi:hypothetical protein
MSPVPREVEVVRYRVAGFWRRLCAGLIDRDDLRRARTEMA